MPLLAQTIVYYIGGAKILRSYDEKTIRKRWKVERRQQMNELLELVRNFSSYEAITIERGIKKFMEENELGFGDVLPILRLAVSGTTKGPSVFEMMELLGQGEVIKRMEVAYEYFDEVKEQVN